MNEDRLETREAATEAHCMPVHYELLVKAPEYWMRRVFRFLNIPFDSRVLDYRQQIGHTGGIRVSR